MLYEKQEDGDRKDCKYSAVSRTSSKIIEQTRGCGLQTSESICLKCKKYGADFFLLFSNRQFIHKYLGIHIANAESLAVAS